MSEPSQDVVEGLVTVAVAIIVALIDLTLMALGLFFELAIFMFEVVWSMVLIVLCLNDGE